MHGVVCRAAALGRRPRRESVPGHASISEMMCCPGSNVLRLQRLCGVGRVWRKFTGCNICACGDLKAGEKFFCVGATIFLLEPVGQTHAGGRLLCVGACD